MKNEQLNNRVDELLQKQGDITREVSINQAIALRSYGM
jgi:predicted flap endonuclease-1-like 5' DNA nuclease